MSPTIVKSEKPSSGKSLIGNLIVIALPYITDHQLQDRIEDMSIILER